MVGKTSKSVVKSREGKMMRLSKNKNGGKAGSLDLKEVYEPGLTRAGCQLGVSV